jgi:hypothetical protein
MQPKVDTFSTANGPPEFEIHITGICKAKYSSKHTGMLKKQIQALVKSWKSAVDFEREHAK